jgi:hypothetical protein
VTIDADGRPRSRDGAARVPGASRRLLRRRPRRPLLMLLAVVLAATTIVVALAWPGIGSALAAGLAVLVTLTALLVMIASRPSDAGDDRSADHATGWDVASSAEVLDRLPFGVLVFDAASLRCTYRNRLGSRCGVSHGAHDPRGPWDDAHLAAVTARLREGAFTEPLPRDPASDSPPAEVRWEALQGRLLATVRDLSDDEEQHMVLSELHLDEVVEGAEPRRRIALEPVCWQVAESLAGDRRPLGVEIRDAEAAVFGDAELLRAAISELVAHSTGAGDDSTPVTLRLATRERSVLVQVDEHADARVSLPATEGGGELALVRRLAALLGGELEVRRVGSVQRTQIDLPRALPQLR